MIDIHAHIIPGVDDGPQDMAVALSLLQQAVANGVTQVVATPHFHLPCFDNGNTKAAYAALKEAVEEAKIPIQLHLGNEVYADDTALQNLSSGTINTLSDSNYILLELPATKIYAMHHDLVFKLQRQGYRIILAHIDRYEYFKEKPELLRGFIDKGCYGQLSAEFVVQRPREAKRWIEAGYAHFIASDMHHPKRRPNRLSEAKQQIRKQLGDQWVQQLFITNPTDMLHHREVLRTTTKDLKRHWLQSFIG